MKKILIGSFVFVSFFTINQALASFPVADYFDSIDNNSTIINTNTYIGNTNTPTNNKIEESLPFIYKLNSGYGCDGTIFYDSKMGVSCRTVFIDSPKIEMAKDNAPFVEVGCSNGQIYDSNTGAVCPMIAQHNDGCPPGALYSNTTGKACPANVVTTGECKANEIFSSTTGIRCLRDVLIDKGCNGLTQYSTITGSYCNNYNGENNSLQYKSSRTIQRGVVGDDVKTIQQYLGVYADGVYGNGTMSKVKEWQRQNGLYPDGIFGSQSQSRLNSLLQIN